MTQQPKCPICSRPLLKIDARGLAWLGLLAIPEGLLFWKFGGALNVIGMLSGLGLAIYYLSRHEEHYCSHCWRRILKTDVEKPS